MFQYHSELQKFSNVSLSDISFGLGISEAAKKSCFFLFGEGVLRKEHDQNFTNKTTTDNSNRALGSGKLNGNCVIYKWDINAGCSLKAAELTLGPYNWAKWAYLRLDPNQLTAR